MNPTAPPETHESPFPRAALWILLAVALFLRIGTNLSRVDENYAEGIYRGSVAAALAQGAPIWARHLAEIPHVPGSIVVAFLAAPFDWVLGPTTFALRFGGTLFHLAALAAWMVLLHRRLGRRVAILGGALFALAPPGFAKMAVLSYGDHVESLPFLFFAAIHNLDWVWARGGARRATPFLAGLGVALAVSFHLQATLGILALAATCAPLAIPRLRERAFWRELFLAFLPGLVAGAVPGALLFYFTGTSALTLWGGSPTEHVQVSGQWAAALEKLRSLVFDGFSYSFQWPNRAVADGTLLLALGCAIGLGVAAVRAMGRRERTLGDVFAAGGFFVVYPIVFSLVFGASSSNFQISAGTANPLEVRYMLPVLPFLLLPIAVAADRLRPRLAILVAAPALALGLAGSLSTWDLPTILREPARRGYLWEEFDSHFLYGTLTPEDQQRIWRRSRGTPRGGPLDSQLEGDVQARADPAKMLELIRRHDTTDEWTWALRYVPPRIPIGSPPDGAEVVKRWIRLVPPRMRVYRAVAAGEVAGGALQFTPGAAAGLLASGDTPDERRALAWGFGRGLLNVSEDGYPPVPRFFDGAKAAARLAALPADVSRADVSFGLGFRVGMMVNEFYKPGDDVIRRAVDAFPKEARQGFARGLGAGYRMRFLKPPDASTVSPAADRLVSLLGSDLGDAFRAGLRGEH